MKWGGIAGWMRFILRLRRPNFARRSFSSRNDSELYDAIVIGGGSGGLAFSKEAAQLGAKVALIDAVEPSPHGTTWGIGGTCVNVGCIPKKLMHQAALVGRFVDHAPKYGWNQAHKGHHDWETLVSVVQDRIKASNWIYRVQLNQKKVKYINACASFLDESSIRTISVGPKRVERVLRAKNFVIATGLRPKYPSIIGANLGITSDDIFSLRRPPGKTIIVGSSYVGLECAGFLRGLGYDVDLMIRSIPLRNFDQCAEMVVQYMADEGVKIMRHFVPLSVKEQSDGRLHLSYRETNGTETNCDSYDTVVWAIGREPRLASMNLQTVGIATAESGRVAVNERDETSIKNIYAIGDIAEGRPELTPPAIKAGQLLARRLFAKSEKLMSYDIVPTTVFTPLEYGAVGLPEEVANERHGENNVEVFHTYYVPYEYVVPQDESSSHCYAKVIALRHPPKTVLGIHIIGPNAAEIIQGFVSGVSIKISSDQLFDTLAIHPCSAEEIVKMTVTKRSGADPKVVGCSRTAEGQIPDYFDQQSEILLQIPSVTTERDTFFGEQEYVHSMGQEIAHAFIDVLLDQDVSIGTAVPSTSTAEEHSSASSSTASAQSRTETKSPHRSKKYQFTYFHYDPPPYWYVWPEIPKSTKPVPHSRRVTPELLKEGQATEGVDKTAATPAPQETTAKAIPTVQPLASTGPAAPTGANVPSSAQATQSQVRRSEQRPVKKLSRFTVTRVRSPPRLPVTTTATATTPQSVDLAKPGIPSMAGPGPTPMVTPARVQQPPLSVAVPAPKVVTVDPATKADRGQQESTIRFVVTPITGQAQKFRVTSLPEKGPSAQHPAVPASYIVTTGREEPPQPIQPTPPTQTALQTLPQPLPLPPQPVQPYPHQAPLKISPQMLPLARQLIQLFPQRRARQAALQIPQQPLPPAQQPVQSFPQQPVNLAQPVHAPASTATAVHTRPTQRTVMGSKRVKRTVAARQSLPVLVEEPELEEMEDVTQAEGISASTSQVSTTSSSSSGPSTGRSTSSWKTVIKRPQKPMLCFVVEPSGRAHSTSSVDTGSSTSEASEQQIQSSTEVRRSSMQSGHKVITFAELYTRVISECNQTETIFERLNTRLCDLERAHEELRARTANRPVQYNHSQ